MNGNFSLFDVLIIIGITQGFVVTGLIWLNKTRTVSKLLLSFVLIVFNLLCIKILIHTTGLWHTRLFRYFPLAFELAIQPLIWLYISSLTRQGFKLSKKIWVHFLPFALSFTYSLFVYILVLQEKAPTAKDAVANRLHFNAVKETEDYISIISAIVYWLLGLRLIMRYRRWLYNNISDTGYPTYAWLKIVSVLMGILIAGLTTDILLDYFFHVGSHLFLHWQVFFIYLALLIYYLGFKGYQLPDKKPATKGQEPLPVQKDLHHPTDHQPLPHDSEELLVKPDEDIPLTKVNQQIKEAILEALEINKLYLDAELNLRKLAKEINISTAVVSAVINNDIKKSFRNLINEYRMEEVKLRLKDPQFNQFSILGVAYECGFNSEASFYRIFKAAVGMSPKQYLKNHQVTK